VRSGRRGAAWGRRGAAAGAAAVALLAGCGSQDDPRRFPPAAEPARSPVPAEAPEGGVVPVGNKPEGVVADTRTGLVAVALTDPDELALVRDGRVVKRVSLPGAPRHLRRDRGTGAVLVPAESGDRLVQVELPSGRSTATRVGDGPHDADAAGGRLFAADEFGSTLSVVEDGRVIRQTKTPLQPGGIAAIPGGPLALVAVRERVLALFDTDGREIDRAAAGVGPTHVEAGAGGRVYVADTQGDAILLFKTRPELELVRRVALPGAPYGMTIDRERGRLWVTLTETNEAVWLPANGAPRPVDRYPTVRQPNSIAVHEPSGRVFVASRSDGTLQSFVPSR
jgi:DNA-binding beta-propeller fold protein YncE